MNEHNHSPFSILNSPLPSGYKQTDVGVIPEEWEVKTFGDIGESLIGLTYKPTDVRPDGILVLRSSNIRESTLRFNDNVFVDMEVPERLMVRVGDILICVRNGSRELIGKCVRLDERAKGMTFGAFMAVFRTPAYRFVYHQLQSAVLKRQIHEHLGATINQITNKSLNSFSIPLPRQEAEQEAIAEALSDADALIESLEQLLAKKRQIKQGAMQELLIAKKRLPGFSGEWEVKRIADLAVLSKTGINPGSNPEALFTHFSLPAFDAGAVPVVEQGGLIGSNKFVVPPNAVLLSKLNPRIPRIWAPSHIPTNAVCSTEFLVLVPREGTDRGFLTTLCCSPAVSYQMELHAIGTTGSHQRINPTQALAIEVSTPSDKAEQIAIATIFSDMDGEIAALEAKLAKARQLKQGMMQELLTGRIRLKN